MTVRIVEITIAAAGSVSTVIPIIIIKIMYYISIYGFETKCVFSKFCRLHCSKNICDKKVMF